MNTAPNSRPPESTAATGSLPNASENTNVEATITTGMRQVMVLV